MTLATLIRLISLYVYYHYVLLCLFGHWRSVHSKPTTAQFVEHMQSLGYFIARVIDVCLHKYSDPWL